MRYLGIDTTKKQSYLFLGDDDKQTFKMLSPFEKHSETLMINVDKFLCENQVQLNDIDVFANVSGPGSFTGIRIGLAVVKAFAYAKAKPIVNINIFEILQKYVKNGVILMECTSTTLYYGVIEKGKLMRYGVVDRDKIHDVVVDGQVFVLEGEHIDVPDAYKINVIDTYGNIANNQIHNAVLEKKFVKNPQPFYIQLSQAERMLMEKESSNAHSEG